MSVNTEISWTDSTWNPIRGCTRVSEGCRNCYAEKVAYRFSGEGLPYAGLAVLKNGHPSWTGKVEFVEKHLLDPLKWGRMLADCWMCGAGPNDTCMHGSKASPWSSRWRSRRIFVNSMSDLFHEAVTDEMRDKIFAVMALCPQHIFQVLTKRPEQMLKYLTDRNLSQRIHERVKGIMGYDNPKRPAINPSDLPLPNVWPGVSVENQKAADDRLDYLCELASRGWQTMVSFEPLLGAVDPGKWWLSLGQNTWAIVGGESGPGARPMQAAWARSLRDQCAAAGVPYFFKQWGAWVPTTDPKVAAARGIPLENCMSYVGKRAAGALLDGVEHKAFPEGK